MIGIGMVGMGYWGPNLLRNFSEISDCKITAVCDSNPKRLQAVAKKYPGVAISGSIDSLISNPGVDAIVIATPANTHFDVAIQCLNAGKHVFVEKPLALKAEHCEALIATATRKGLRLMVGHTFLYNAAVSYVKKLIHDGSIGDVLYVYCQRLNLGKVRDDLDVVWNLAPHDISILCHWFDSLPSMVRAKGYSYLQQGLADVAFITMDFPNMVGANIHVSWLDPNKTRVITVVGTKKMIVYDDVALDHKITIFDKGVQNPETIHARLLAIDKSFDDFRIELREGDITIPHIKVHEPLREECEGFVRYVVKNETPPSDGKNGLDVVRVLQACSLSMADDGSAIPL